MSDKFKVTKATWENVCEGLQMMNKILSVANLAGTLAKLG